MQSMQSTLSSLRDVNGVIGSFVIDEAGQLRSRDLPAVFHDDVLVESGPRIVRVCETIEHGGEALDSLVLRFADHKLHVRRSRGGLLCVIANADSNPPALRMALALVARRLGTSVSPPASEPPPATSPVGSAEPQSPASAPPKKWAKLYRGHPVR